MNILFISNLSGLSFAGPTYSVPKQIEAQTKVDNVFWYNVTVKGKEEWRSLSYYHDLTEFPDESIYSLPEPFNKPDIIIVEQFYNMARNNIRKELVKGKIPYIIIPRGEFTHQAQMRKRMKKRLANLFLFRKFARNASAIQYLTEQEYIDSGDEWNSKHIVIPNGIDIPANVKKDFSRDGIKCISIGRIEPYQKGLDLLIEACSLIKEDLFKENCTITICGPDREGKLEALKEMVTEKELQDIILFHEAVYGEEKEKMLLDSDVFVIPSRFEGHPMALIEALSYGLPVIATTGSNMRDDIDKYNAGWTADSNVESIADTFKRMIDSFSDVKKYSINSIELSKKYSWKLIAKMQNMKDNSIVYYGRK
ncbi:glycosyltransferase family 4 protein [Ruminococcus sp.]|uniref:glycosyltransferase family 4 protein n=1 Tax=Ruminococcus sp. TaxID=41978 RepID=UPI0025DC14E8|nr:glycosyltransferase family 4 protein [Ruminococcus sp.]